MLVLARRRDHAHRAAFADRRQQEGRPRLGELDRAGVGVEHGVDELRLLVDQQEVEVLLAQPAGEDVAQARALARIADVDVGDLGQHAIGAALVPAPRSAR